MHRYSIKTKEKKPFSFDQLILLGGLWTANHSLRDRYYYLQEKEEAKIEEGRRYKEEKTDKTSRDQNQQNFLIASMEDTRQSRKA